MTIPIDLAGRIALVTGGGGGIGSQIGRTLRDAGAQVALADVDEAGLKAHSDIGLPVVLDLTDPDSVRAGVDQAEGELGPIDLLVNNAGLAAQQQGMPFTNQDPQDWEIVLRVNLIGMFIISKELAPRMLERESSSIVNISSVSGRAGLQTDPAYSASKAAVVNFTQVMAKDLAPNVRVNAIAPGMVLTPFYRSQHQSAAAKNPEVAEMTPEEFFNQKAKRLIPLQRGQDPSEIANAVAFLASNLARSITGQTLNVDGGLVMS